MDALTNHSRGIFEVRTASGSVYRLALSDDGQASLVRVARDQVPTHEFADLPVSDLRNDGKHISLLGIDKLAVGQRGALWLDIRGDGVETLRVTTPVVSISRLGI